MKINEVSKAVGISASAIRYYEQQGVLDRQARISGRRAFDQQAVVTLQFIRLAQAAGFTISEMKSLLENYNETPDSAGMWQSQADSKRRSIHEKISKLRRMDQVLERLQACKCATINECVEMALNG